MLEEPIKTVLDRELISLGKEHERRDWAKSLGCTEEELHWAVIAVGNSADAVRKYLADRR
jgi:hypothetical protein